RDGVVVADHLAALPERALSELTAEEEAGLLHVREDEDPLRLLPEPLRTRLLPIELVQLGAGVAAELRGGSGFGRPGDRGGQNRGQRDRQSHRLNGSHHVFTLSFLIARSRKGKRASSPVSCRRSSTPSLSPRRAPCRAFRRARRGRRPTRARRPFGGEVP